MSGNFKTARSGSEGKTRVPTSSKKNNEIWWIIGASATVMVLVLAIGGSTITGTISGLFGGLLGGGSGMVGIPAIPTISADAGALVPDDTTSDQGVADSTSSLDATTKTAQEIADMLLSEGACNVAEAYSGNVDENHNACYFYEDPNSVDTCRWNVGIYTGPITESTISTSESSIYGSNYLVTFQSLRGGDVADNPADKWASLFDGSATSLQSNDSSIQCGDFAPGGDF